MIRAMIRFLFVIVVFFYGMWEAISYMARELTVAEDHKDPYVWAAVALAHAFIGVLLYAAIGGYAIIVYLSFEAFEAFQAVRSRGLLLRDTVVDALAVLTGMALLEQLMYGSGIGATVAVCAGGIGILSGIRSRLPTQ